MHKVLIVDDEPAVFRIIGPFLKENGFLVLKAHNGEQALEKCNSFKPDVVLLDIRMPKMDGTEALKRIKKNHPFTEVIMTTADDDISTAISCMKDGAFGYQIKPVDLKTLSVEIERALEHKRMILEIEDYKKNLENKVRERTRTIENLNTQLKESFIDTIKIASGLIEGFDAFLSGHSKRVTLLVRKICFSLKFIENPQDLEIAALLHDIGMVTIPDHVKNTPFAKLKREEIKIVRNHTIFSQEILSSSKELVRPGLIIRHHLERLDGTGFPDGLKGDEIPIESKILGVANAYDELVTRRRFTNENFPSESITMDFAFNQLEKSGGIFYEKSLIETLERTVRGYSKVQKSIELESENDLKPGMVLAVDLMTTDGRLFMAKNSELGKINVIKIQTLYTMKLMDQKLYVYEN